MIALAIGAGLWLVWTQLLYPTHMARYELIVEVETPAGIKTGSSVIEANYGWETKLFGLISGVKNSVRGEAVFVDLGDGKNLVVTLRAGDEDRSSELNAQRLPSALFDFPSHDRIQTPEGIRKAMDAGIVDVPVGKLPFVVTFPVATDPMSVKKLNPLNIGELFGSGYDIKRATIHITNKRPVEQIVSKLPWLVVVKGKLLTGKTTNFGALYGLHSRDFKRTEDNP